MPEYQFLKRECRKCGRKILVEIILIGASHNADILVICAECLTISPGYREQHPTEAAEIEAWAKTNG